MEQKQLDELDETPLEEYIEEEDEVEDFKAKKKAMKKPKKSPWKEESPEQEESTSSPGEENTTPTAQESSFDASTDAAKETRAESEKPEPLMTSKGWMIVSILLLLLLVMAIFTGGFGMIGKKQISQSDAEAKVLAYVNTELLQGDTKATVVSSADAGEQYKITLAVAGETVDTYLTKDGKMFFPQGFAVANMTASTPAVTVEPSENAYPTPAANIPISTTPTEPAVTAKPARTIELNLAAKKWVFTPTMMNAAAGDHIKLTINPTALDFTFSIPELKIEKNITKTSVIEFDVPTAGNYTFTCLSCEDYRGMTGKIIVE